MGKEPALLFQRESRLCTPSLYRRVFESPSKRFQTRSFRLLCLENELNHPRLGVVVSKKSSPLAVRRNMVKRVVRDSFRRYSLRLGKIDVVVIAKEGSMKFSKPDFTDWKEDIKKQLRQEIETLWQKLMSS
ncbi:MAG: rnpA [Gammaproteobacteria bacterium]|jgi:ribonuclease P protein component|nr:rnpA [Gammaproteobacteria bacterium]